MIYEITRKLGATRGWKDGGEAFVVAANVLGECLKTGQLLLRSLLSIFVLGTALRDSYCVPLWAKAIVPSSDRFPLFRPVFMQSAVQVRSIHRIIDRGSRSSSIIFLLFRWKEISLFSFFLRERFIIIKIYLLVLACLGQISNISRLNIIRLYLEKIGRSVLDFCFERNLFPIKI